LPKTVTRQRRGCDLNPGPSAPESSTLTTRLPSHPSRLEVHLGLLKSSYRGTRGVLQAPPAGSGRSPNRNRIWCILALKYGGDDCTDFPEIVPTAEKSQPK